TIPGVIAAAAGKECGAALAHVQVGDTPAAVTATLGAPDRSPGCWLFRWPTDRNDPSDGARICFAAGRVARVQIAVHG
ncbi:MAG TPA: hypothetical protein VGU02_01860, partial [Gaiellaceae bacterium]|nr:hypothetical protein [Gaiellaceae bacterium]